MTSKVLIAFHSRGGLTEAPAKAVAEGHALKAAR